MFVSIKKKWTRRYTNVRVILLMVEGGRNWKNDSTLSHVES